MIPECNPVTNHPPREDMNANVLMFEDILEEEVENLYKKFCIYKSSGIRGVSIWAYLWRTSGQTCGAMNNDMSAFMGLSPNKDLKNGLILAESVSFLTCQCSWRLSLNNNLKNGLIRA